MRLRLIILCSATVSLLFAFGCSKRETPVEIGDREQIFHRGIGSEPKDLDPHIVTGLPEFNVIISLLEGLTGYDPATLKPVPAAAESWIISDDGKTYTFKLRQNAKWSNGDPVTANDFSFSFRRILSPNLGSAYAYMLFCLENAEEFNKGEITDFSQVGVKVIDKYTLELKLSNPVPYFLALLAHQSWYPVHPPTILKFGEIDTLMSKWTRAKNYVGNGPFVLKSWIPNKKIQVTKSQSYWDKETVRLNEIHFYPIGDHTVEERSFRAGQLHVTETMPLDRIKHYQKNNPDLVMIEPYLGVYHYLLNKERPPLDNKKVRRALSLSINRDQLVKYVTQAGEEAAYNFTPPNIGGYSTSDHLEYDPEKARALLAEAGFPNGKGFPKLELLFNTADQHVSIAEAIQQMWKKELNVEISLVNMEWKVYLATTQARNYDMARMSWIGDYADPNTFFDLWLTGGGNNRTGWSNAEYDGLIKKAAAASTQEARFEIFRKAEQILIEESPVIPIYYYVSKSLIKPSVRGWSANLMDIHPYKHIHLEVTGK